MAKFYVVWRGRKPGIYKSWIGCKEQVDEFSGARFKSFGSEQEAEIAFSKSKATKLSKSKTTAGLSNGSKSLKSGNSRKTAIKKAITIDFSETDVSVFSDGGCLKNPVNAVSLTVMPIKAEFVPEVKQDNRTTG